MKATRTMASTSIGTFRCQIPDSLVEQIRKDAVKDYLKQVIP